MSNKFVRTKYVSNARSCRAPTRLFGCRVSFAVRPALLQRFIKQSAAAHLRSHFTTFPAGRGALSQKETRTALLPFFGKRDEDFSNPVAVDVELGSVEALLFPEMSEHYQHIAHSRSSAVEFVKQRGVSLGRRQEFQEGGSSMSLYIAFRFTRPWSGTSTG